jgi:hypothetical protein
MHKDVDEEIETCDAFPDGIPDDVLFGDRPHTKPIAGDNGLQYEPEPGFEDRQF